MDIQPILYDITERDRASVQFEMWTRNGSLALGVGVGDTSAQLDIPSDRALLLKKVVLFLSPGSAGSVWTGGYVGIGNPGSPGPNAIVHADQIPNRWPADTGGRITFHVDLMISASLRLWLGVTRSGTTASTTAGWWLTGYLVPQGTMARGF